MPETKKPIPDDNINYNRRIFKFLNFTPHRQIINTVLHEYTHLVGIGHGEPKPEDPMDNKHSIKVRGFTEDEALNSAEVHMRFIRAVSN